MNRFKKFSKQFITSTLVLSLILSSAYFLPASAHRAYANVIATSSTASTSLNDTDFDSDVIYEIVTDRFYDGDATNNPTGALYDSTHTSLKKYFGGDWQGITDKINDGYFTNMGITALWISQPVENIYTVFSDGSTSYHGYYARDYKKTNPFFGSFSDFQNLIDTAHAHNMKVIIDFAPNHTSPSSSTDASYAENGNLYDNGTLLGGYANDTNGYFNHYGGTDFSTLENCIYKNLYDLSDLNQQNSTIDKYLKDAINLWIDKGIDGIRLDAVKHMPFGWQKNFMNSINNHKEVFTFGEWFLGTNETDSNNSYYANESGASLLDFRFAQKTRQVFRDGGDTMKGLDSMISSTAADYNFNNDLVTFIDNHDMDRFYKAGTSTRNTEEALAFTLTSRGVPAIYYGTEQYMTGNGDPNNRAMMTGFNTNTTAYKEVKALATLRKSNPAIEYGNTTQRWLNDDVYIYERKFGNNTALVAINRNQSSSYNISGLYTSLPNGTYTDVLGGLLNGNSISVNSTAVSNFTLGAGAVAVWQYTANTTTPTIGHVGPNTLQPGKNITIDGSGFGTSTGTVKFGTTNATIVSWSDSQIVATVPQVSSGKYDVKVTTSGGVTSNTFSNFNVLTSNQVSVRFVVNNATTNLGQNVYLVGSVGELGNWDTKKAIGSMFNTVVYQYPTWYYDVSVPAGTQIQFKFVKSDGTTVTWEGGSNHTYTTPTSGTATVNVNWQQ